MRFGPVYSPVIALARTLFALQGLRFAKIGTEHIPDEGGAVLAMNHISFFDYAYVGLSALERGRVIRFLAKKEVFDNPVAGPLLRSMKHVRVDRSAGAGAYRAAVSALRDGELVGVFPEGTISRSFELRPFKSGAVRMAREAGVPIVPVIVWGSHRVWAKDLPKRLGRSRTPIVVRAGAPVAMAPDATVAEMSAQLKEVMRTMLHEVQESYPELAGDDARFLPARLGGTAPTLEEAEELDRAEAQARRARRAAKA
ncbi:1-acyl-sn-glycerol-3-phosphate acyltransferase [Amycolatopsis sp. AA4]|uniref:lysophospholipid acyltransferase family protein n=1 Tax=Actinomycetes TaxID=1760 RepID=UPI0001B54A5B|nr:MULTISPECIES: lysophospholipid acyltransferase family protein [Actinomycetes]ATY10045.1 1-acyl-sn-glycerol-3-phosphate acyltransferase [Amycolatopsis sp. AA4]EFL05475.1 1-acyl-sn-glycerol-3-phosphate acyltransferase [Streptomyces sp. AA4]